MTTHQLHETPPNGTTPEAPAPPETHQAPPAPAAGPPPPPPFLAPTPPGGSGRRIALVAAGTLAVGGAAGFVYGRRTAPSTPVRQLRRLRRKAVVGTARRAPRLALRSARTAPKTTRWVLRQAPRAALSGRRAVRRLPG